jgi:hypothetical protein
LEAQLEQRAKQVVHGPERQWNFPRTDRLFRWTKELDLASGLTRLRTCCALSQPILFKIIAQDIVAPHPMKPFTLPAGSARLMYRNSL